MTVLSGALLSGKAAKARAKRAGFVVIPALIPSQFLCPQAWLVCAPNQSRRATQKTQNYPAQ